MKTKLVKRIASCSLWVCALVSLVAAITLGTSSTATARAGLAPETCSVNTLKGSYLFATHGWNIVAGVAVPKAIVEGINFNGDGTLVSPFATVSINGNIFHFGASPLGSYTVDTDCTGTIAFAGGITYDIFVDPNGQQLWLIQTGPAPAVFEGTATRLP